MNQRAISPEELRETHDLISSLCDGHLTEEQSQRLRALLQQHRDARRLYLQLMQLEAALNLNMAAAAVSVVDENEPAEAGLSDAMILPALHEIEEASIAPETIPFPVAAPVKATAPSGGPARYRRHLNWKIAAAVLLPVLIASAVFWRARTASSGATLVSSIDAEWDGGIRLQAGDVLPRASLSLKAGVAKIVLKNGVTVVVEGPARFEAVSANVTRLDSGKLAAVVPVSGHGFMIETASLSVIDLGTEFGVDVHEDQSAHVEVFRGSIRAQLTHASAASSQTLTQGQAIEVDKGGTELSASAPSPGSFVRDDELAARIAARAGSSYDRWLACSYQLQRDPDLVAYYTFENTSSTGDRLANLTSAGSALDGVLGGDESTQSPSWTTGRWPQKGALHFARDTQQRVEIPSEIDGPLDFSRGDDEAVPFTICLWVCGDGAPPPGNASILGKGMGYAEQLALDSFFGTSVRGWIRDSSAGDRDVDPKDLLSNSPLSPDWQQLVFNYDPSHGDLKLYRNGVLSASRNDVPRHLLKTAAPLVIGSREGDRHSPNTDGTPSRFGSMAGRIDELAIFKRSLSAEQIREIYLAEKPD